MFLTIFALFFYFLSVVVRIIVKFLLQISSFKKKLKSADGDILM